MDRIVILGTAYPYRGGLASFNELLARSFGRQGKKVHIITFRLQYPELLFPGKTQFSESPAPAGLEITRMVNAVNPLNWIQVGRRIRKMRPDMMVLKYWTPFMSPCLGTVCRIVRQNKHTVILSQLDNIIPHEHHFYDRILTRYFVKSVDGFIYMSQQVRDDLHTFTTVKPSIFAPHPVFDNFGARVSKIEACRQLNLPPGQNYLLFFGLIRDYKGLDLMLDAWHNLKQKHATENKKLIVAGEFYTDKTKYIRQMEHLGIQGDILLHDRFIRDEDVKYYFSLADAVVQPYKSATQSGVTQIAYHFEVPMIVTSVGGLAEIVPDGKAGYIVDPDAKRIAEAIEKIYQNDNLQKMIELIKIEKKRFSWEYFTSQLSLLCEKVLSNRSIKQ